jgi:molybdopterin converting factor small subunit
MSDPTHVTVEVELHGHIASDDADLSLHIQVPRSISEALRDLRRDLPAVDQALKTGSVVVLVNGRDLRRWQGESIELSEGDVISLLPFVAGG